MMRSVRSVAGQWLACPLAAALLLLGAETGAVEPAGAEPPATAHPELWPAGSGGVLIRPEIEQKIAAILAQMTLEEKIGQMIQADIDSITPDDLATYKLGSILAGGNAAPGGDVHSGPEAWRTLVDSFRAASIRNAAPGHTPIPMLFGIDAVHGDAKVRGATIFPHNVALGATHDPDLVRRIGAATASEVFATGVDWTFAPTVAVVRDVRWGRSYESFSEDPAEVATMGRAMLEGIQGRVGSPEFLAAGHTLGSIKHFLGDGGTFEGHDQGDNPSSEAVLRDVHGAGYIAAIPAGATVVMASYNSWQGVKMHDNASLLTGVLKERLHFDGFVVGDWNAQEELPGCTKISCPDMIDAGVDMVMAPDSWKALYHNMLDQAQRGAIPMARIDDAVRRILRVKALAGVFAPEDSRSAARQAALGQFGGAEHRALARAAARESLVLLKNNGGVLPLRPNGKILVVGAAADSMAAQCGGWTVDWQGDKTRNEDIPAGTTIFAGIAAAVRNAGGQATLSPDGSFSDRPDAAIVVFGEGPYAEFEGDRENLILYPDADPALATLKRLADQHIPVVAVLLSGRPLWVNREINAADAFVAAWLPGMAGEGVADMLFTTKDGAVAHDFSGRLPFSWPATAMPVRFADDGSVTGAQFPRGYGLSLAAAIKVGELSEDPKTDPDHAWTPSQPGMWMHAGRPIAPWSVYVEDSQAEVRLTQRAQASPADAVSTTRGQNEITASWTGHGSGSWRIGGRAVDLSAAAKSGGAVAITYRVTHATEAPVMLSMGCGKDCRGGFDIANMLEPSTGDGWRRITVPIACFAEAGVDLTKVEAPVILEADTQLSLVVQDAWIDRAPPPTPCPHAR